MFTGAFLRRDFTKISTILSFFETNKKEKIELLRYQVVIIWLLHENAFFIFGLNQMQTRGGIEINEFRIELLSNFLNNFSPFESIEL